MLRAGLRARALLVDLVITIHSFIHIHSWQILLSSALLATSSMLALARYAIAYRLEPLDAGSDVQARRLVARRATTRVHMLMKRLQGASADGRCPAAPSLALVRRGSS